ncbi:MAG: 2-hydroxymuconate tautomerase [Parvibaculaceae bacterium]
MLIVPDSDGDAQAKLLKLFWQGLRERFAARRASTATGGQCPAGQSGSLDMPTIHVEILAGRSAEQKRALVKGMTDCFIAHCGGTPAGIQVVISEFAKDQWAVGGELISDKKA